MGCASGNSSRCRTADADPTREVGAVRVLDLFAGGGGFSQGFKEAGHPVTVAVDNWKPARETHQANHPDAEIIDADIGELDPTTLGRFDVVIGSPPCPEFSVANKNRDPEKGMVLVRKFIAIKDAVRPRFWVMENVAGVADYLPNGIPVVQLLNAADYGVPQKRYRIFAGSYNVPQPSHADVEKERHQRTLFGTEFTLKPWVAVREALGISGVIKRGRGASQTRPDSSVDDPSPAVTGYDGGTTGLLLFDGLNIGGSRAVSKPSYTIRATGTQHGIAYGTEKGRWIDDMEEPAPTIVIGGGPGNAGGGRPPRIAVGGPGTNGRKNARPLKLDSPANTIGDVHHDYVEPLPGYRRLEPEECAILQGFPPDYIFVGSKTSRYKIVGNAVCPPLARAIAEATLG